MSWVSLTSHQTHYRSYQERCFTGQMTQPTVSTTGGRPSIKEAKISVFVTVLHWMQRGLCNCKAVCPSVCLSGNRMHRDKTKAPSKKSSVMTNRMSTTISPVSLRWSWRAYVAPKSPNGASETKIDRFSYKKWAFLEESVTKFLCVKTLSGKVVRHSLAYL